MYIQQDYKWRKLPKSHTRNREEDLLLSLLVAWSKILASTIWIASIEGGITLTAFTTHYFPYHVRQGGRETASRFSSMQDTGDGLELFNFYKKDIGDPDGVILSGKRMTEKASSHANIGQRVIPNGITKIHYTLLLFHRKY